MQNFLEVYQMQVMERIIYLGLSCFNNIKIRNIEIYLNCG